MAAKDRHLPTFSSIRLPDTLAWGLALLALLPHFLGEALAADVVSSPDFSIDTSEGEQRFPSVSSLSGGGFVVTWYGNESGGNGTDIYGRRYDNAGVPLSPNFLVNTQTAGDQQFPSVSGLATGGFVITWYGVRPSGKDGDIYGRLYDTSGIALGSDFFINSVMTGTHLAPSVAGLRDGGFIVTWEGTGVGDGPLDIHGRRFGATGMPLAPDFLINTDITGPQYNPSVSGLADGGFVVSWHGAGPNGNDTGIGIFGRRYDGGGSATGPSFLANRFSGGVRSRPSVASLSNGGFVVTWHGAGPNGIRDDIYGRLFDAAGMTQGPPFLVNTYTPGGQCCSSVSSLSDGGFVATWHGDGLGSSGNDIYGRLYDAKGVASTTSFPINSHKAKEQLFPSVSGLTDGSFVVTWQGVGPGSAFIHIYGRIFTLNGTTPSPPPAPQAMDGTTTLFHRATTPRLTGSTTGMTSAPVTQPFMDSPEPFLAAGVSTALVAVVCSLLSVLAIMLRRRRPAPDQEDGSRLDSNRSPPTTGDYQQVRLSPPGATAASTSHESYQHWSQPISNSNGEQHYVSWSQPLSNSSTQQPYESCTEPLSNSSAQQPYERCSEPLTSSRANSSKRRSRKSRSRQRSAPSSPRGEGQ